MLDSEDGYRVYTFAQGLSIVDNELILAIVKEKGLMKRLSTRLACVAALLLACAASAAAQVSKVEMRIDGYLCGN